VAKKRGFSIVEVLVAVAIGAIIVAALTRFTAYALKETKSRGKKEAAVRVLNEKLSRIRLMAYEDVDTKELNDRKELTEAQITLPDGVKFKLYLSYQVCPEPVVDLGFKIVEAEAKWQEGQSERKIRGATIVVP